MAVGAGRGSGGIGGTSLGAGGGTTPGGGGFPSGGTTYAPGSAGVNAPTRASVGSPCELWDKGQKVAGYYNEQGKCVAQPTSGPGDFFAALPGQASGGAAAPAATKPTAPAITPPREIGANIPELERLGQGYEQHLRNLESGAGYSADVLAGQTRDQTEAQVATARAAAEAQGRPFDEEKMRAELQRGSYSAQAEEKLGREKMLTEAYGQAPSVVGANEAAREARWKTGSGNDLAAGALANQQFATQAGMYGNELDAATSANNSLLSFLSNLYSGAFNAASGVSLNQRYG
jgi:hypothetical protein